MKNINKVFKPFALFIWTVIVVTALVVFPNIMSAQVVGKTQTEEYRASFERKVNIDSLMDYDGPKIPIQLLNIGINEEDTDY